MAALTNIRRLLRLRCKENCLFALGAILCLAVYSGDAISNIDSDADAFNYGLAAQSMGGLYQFTTNSLLPESTDVLTSMGANIIKIRLTTNALDNYNLQIPAGVTNLAMLARDEPNYRYTFDHPALRYYVMWTYICGRDSDDFVNGFSNGEHKDEYRQIYDLTTYFLTNYNNSGKRFYLGHWEGDWVLLPNNPDGTQNSNTNPTPTAIQGMIDWLNTRQQAVDDATRDTPHTNVAVYCYAEANQVSDPKNNPYWQRVINAVVPNVTNLDYVSYSSWEMKTYSAQQIKDNLSYMAANMTTNKSGLIPGQRVFIGEYGWGGATDQEQLADIVNYSQACFQWGTPFLLWWELYNSDPALNHSLINSNNVKKPNYYFHQYFLNDAKLWIAEFKQNNARLPTISEYQNWAASEANSLATLAPTVALALNNLPANVGNQSATLTGTLRQGLYGDEWANLYLYWGASDGGTNQSSWQHEISYGLNHQYGTVVVSTNLTGLAPGTTYYFRMFASNSLRSAWAPVTTPFTTTSADRKMKITLNYDRSEPLTNFPVLLNLSTAISNFNYATFVSTNGWDLRIRDAASFSNLNYEIERWDTNGTSLVWVQVPRLVNGTALWLYWGPAFGTSALPCLTNGTTWSNNYLAVWHLDENGFPYADSTTVNPGTTGTAPIRTNGVVSFAQNFNIGPKISVGSINLGSTMTFSAWVKLNATATNSQTLIANKTQSSTANGCALQINGFQTADGAITFASGDGINGKKISSPINLVPVSQWHHVAATVNRAAGTVSIYSDGVLQTNASGVNTNFANNQSAYIGQLSDGNLKLNGQLDEVRISGVERSANWIWASYQCMASNSPFCTYEVDYNTDSIGDGIPDWWRMCYFGNGFYTNAAACAACDPDGDGQSNLAEYLAGTNPTNPASLFRIQNVAQLAGGNLQLNVLCGTNIPLLIEASTTLTNWFSVLNTNPVTAPLLWTDPAGASSPARFYRAVRP